MGGARGKWVKQPHGEKWRRKEGGKVTGSKTCRGLGARRGMGVSMGKGMKKEQVYINTNAFLVWVILLLLPNGHADGSSHSGGGAGGK